MRFTRTLRLPLALVLALAAPCVAATISGTVTPVGNNAEVLLFGKDEDPAAQVVEPDKLGGLCSKGCATEHTLSKFMQTATLITSQRHQSSSPRTASAATISSKLVPGATLKGKITPVGIDPHIELRGDEESYSAYYDSDTGYYKTDKWLPTGDYHLTATAKSYAPIEKTVKLTAPKTTVVDISFLRTGSISGKISPAPLEGGIIAKKGHEPVGDTKIQRDGSYKVETSLPEPMT